MVGEVSEGVKVQMAPLAHVPLAVFEEFRMVSTGLERVRRRLE
jgi:hypothetical protein